MSSLPPLLRLDNLFKDFMPPSIVQLRDPYWRDTDTGIFNQDQNLGLRLRSYDSDGHNYRQEMTLAAGERAGAVFLGNDRVDDSSYAITYADVVVTSARSINFQSGQGGLFWNFTPFNPRFNPTFQMPAALRTAEDAFQFTKAAVPGANSLLQAQRLLGVQFQSPFDVFSALTPQQVPLMTLGAVKALDLLLHGGGYMAPPSPALLALQPLVGLESNPLYQASVQGSLLGQVAKEALLANVPGIGSALALGN